MAGNLAMNTNRSFTVNLTQLSKSKDSPLHVVLSGPIEAKVTGSAIKPNSQVTLDCRLEQVRSNSVLVTGLVVASWIGECVRCLEVAQGVMEIEVRELFAKKTDLDDELIYPLENDFIELEPMVRDACLLELPQLALCMTTCKGLCSECGANLNEGPCGCIE